MTSILSEISLEGESKIEALKGLLTDGFISEELYLRLISDEVLPGIVLPIQRKGNSVEIRFIDGSQIVSRKPISYISLYVEKDEFKKIVSGEQKEIYLDVNEVWIEKLTNFKFKNGPEIIEHLERMEGKIEDIVNFEKEFEYVDLASNWEGEECIQTLRIECLDVNMIFGSLFWYMKEGNWYFKIDLGKIIS